MNNETFMTANECVDYGFADEIVDEVKEDNITNAIKSLNEMKDNFEKSMKMFTDIKNLGFEANTQVGGSPVDDEEKALNTKTHNKWDWLRKGE